MADISEQQNLMPPDREREEPTPTLTEAMDGDIVFPLLCHKRAAVAKMAFPSLGHPLFDLYIKRTNFS